MIYFSKLCTICWAIPKAWLLRDGEVLLHWVGKIMILGSEERIVAMAVASADARIRETDMGNCQRVPEPRRNHVPNPRKSHVPEYQNERLFRICMSRIHAGKRPLISLLRRLVWPGAQAVLQLLALLCRLLGLHMFAAVSTIEASISMCNTMVGARRPFRSLVTQIRAL